MKKRPWSRSVGKSVLALAVLVGASVFGQSLASAQSRTIDCASESGRHRYCQVRTDGYVRLDEQLSDAACVAGRTWGYDDWGIWVDNGCRARFVVGRGGYYNAPRRRRPDADDRDYYDERARPAQRIQCASQSGRYNYCPADTGGYVQLERQLSDARCEKWRTWGYDSGGVWVDRGCRAQFTIGRRRGYSRDWPWQ